MENWDNTYRVARLYIFIDTICVLPICQVLFYLYIHVHELLAWEALGSFLFKKWYLSATICRLRFHPRYPDSGGQGRREAQCILEKCPSSRSYSVSFLLIPSCPIVLVHLAIPCQPIKSSLPDSYSLLAVSFKRAADLLL